MKFFLGVVLTSLVCLSFVESTKPKSFEGTVKYTVLENSLTNMDFTEVDYFHKGEMHRYDFKGSGSTMTVLAMDGSPFWTICMEWMGQKVAFQENIDHACMYSVEEKESNDSKKHVIGYDCEDRDFVGAKKYECTSPFIEKDPNSNETVNPLPLKFHLCLNEECFYLESTNVQEKAVEASLFEISDD
ncbi:MAG: hypothetical protein AAF193_02745, partial [Bacteroidota bacterium]